MAYNNWKLMDKVGVSVCSIKQETWRGKDNFDGHLFEVGDENGQKKAEEWARRYDNRYDSTKETIVHEPNVHLFDNEGFTVTILDSAGGSSQGGRLSFWKCRVEKDGIQFVVGVNDGILADLIRNSDIKQGVVQQKVMFARQSGQPGFIHSGMDSYAEAIADMQKKADLKKAKKTSKWEIGGVYATLTQEDLCLGQVWDTMEEYQDPESRGWYPRFKLRKTDTPKKVYVWTRVSSYRHPEDPTTLDEFLKRELEEDRVWYYTGKPPARSKAKQLEVKESDMKLLDKYLEKYNEGRFVRELKDEG